MGEERRADERTRTADLLITSELLYLLSYVGLYENKYIAGVQGFHMVVGLTLIRTGSSLYPLLFGDVGASRRGGVRDGGVGFR